MGEPQNSSGARITVHHSQSSAMRSAMKVPESLKEEHEELLDGIKKYSRGNDRTGASVRELLRTLEPHVEKENEVVLPLLGVLAGLAVGEPVVNPGAVMHLHEKYVGEYRGMFMEHAAIRRAIAAAKRSAKAEGHEHLSETLDALLHHSRIEEEALYPAALVVGLAVSGWQRSTARVHGSADEKTSGVGPEGGLSIFTLDYDEAISSVTKKLMVKHEEIDAILSEVGELANKGKVKVAISLLYAISPLILRSAVEEEARIMREVMQRHKDSAQDSIAATREHRAIADFLKHQLPELGRKPPEEARRSIVGFVELVHGHLREEEKTSFSLANE
jgi:hemerythrin-like domain-containing protein